MAKFSMGHRRVMLFTMAVMVTFVLMGLASCASDGSTAANQVNSNATTQAVNTTDANGSAVNETGAAANASAANANATTATQVANANANESASTAAATEAQKMQVKITVGEHVIHATLYDNASARQFYDSLPATYHMENLYDREMCYHLGAGTLPADEAANQSYEVGDISYWPPKGSLVILYEQNGEVFQRQPLGHTDDDLSFFAGMPDTDITWEKR